MINKPFQLSLFVFKVTLILIVFLVGGILARKNLPPFNVLAKSYRATQTLVEEMARSRAPLLKEHTYEGDGVVKHDPQQAYKGLTVLQGIFPGGSQLRLIDMDGTVLNVWPVNFFKIWPNPSHLPEGRSPQTPYNYHTQGFVVLPDGSAIVNLQYLGTAKLDKCGNVLWTVDRMTRHFVSPTEDGNYWIGANRDIDKIPDELLFFDIKRSYLKERELQRYENIMLLVSPEGEILKEFSILQAFYDGGYEGHIFDTFQIDKGDLTHHNDLEEVSQALADKIEGVNKGDLLISIRQMHMLAILDKESGAIKWTYSGSWTRQHDPDITPAGNIIVFNNSRKTYGFNRVKGSSLTELDPATNQVRIVYPKEGQPSFNATIFGTHQALPNDNVLISEGYAGRAFEINKQGETVWDFVSRYDDAHASLVEAAHRYDTDYFTVEDWSCDKPNS